jgi:hypothetical protein
MCNRARRPARGSLRMCGLNLGVICRNAQALRASTFHARVHSGEARRFFSAVQQAGARGACKSLKQDFQYWGQAIRCWPFCTASLVIRRLLRTALTRMPMHHCAVVGLAPRLHNPGGSGAGRLAVSMRNVALRARVCLRRPRGGRERRCVPAGRAGSRAIQGRRPTDDERILSTGAPARRPATARRS